MSELIGNLELMQMMLEHDGLFSKQATLAEIIEVFYDHPHPTPLSTRDIVFAKLDERYSEPDKSTVSESTAVAQDMQLDGYL